MISKLWKFLHMVSTIWYFRNMVRNVWVIQEGCLDNYEWFQTYGVHMKLIRDLEVSFSCIWPIWDTNHTTLEKWQCQEFHRRSAKYSQKLSNPSLDKTARLEAFFPIYLIKKTFLRIYLLGQMQCLPIKYAQLRIFQLPNLILIYDNFALLVRS